MKFAVCAIAKNEFNYINEWVAYQKIVGFDDIYIYDNNSNDGTSELLINLDSKNIINRVFWPRLEGVAPQRAAYAHFLEKFSYKYDWVFICDLDEFLIVDCQNVKKFVDLAILKNSDVSAIAIPWLIFGADEQANYRPELVIERFKNCHSQCDKRVKTLFRPDSVYQMRTHIVDLHKGVYLDNSFNAAEWSSKMPIDLSKPDKGYARVHHYFTKSYEEWIKRKSLPKADRTEIEFANIKIFNKYEKLEFINNDMDIYLSAVNQNKKNLDQYSPIKSNFFNAEIIFSSETFLILKITGLINKGVRVVLDDKYEIVTYNLILLDNGDYGLFLNLNIYSIKPTEINISSLDFLNQINIKKENYPSRNYALSSVLKYFKNAEYIKFNIFKRMIKDENRFRICAETEFGDFVKFKEYGGIIHLQKKSYNKSLTKEDILNFLSNNGESGKKAYLESLYGNKFFMENYDFFDELRLN